MPPPRKPSRPAGRGVHAREPSAAPASDRTRELLLEAGRRLFAAHGFDGTSVRDIATEAGVNVSLVSYHFQGKDGLYRTVLEQFGSEGLQAVRSMLQPARTGEEFRVRLQMGLEEMLRLQFARPELCKILHREIDSGLPVAATVFERTFLTVHGAWKDYFESARRAGILADRVDAGTLADLVNSVTFHVFRTDPLRKRYFGETLADDRYRAGLIGQIVDILLQGALRDARAGKKTAPRASKKAR